MSTDFAGLRASLNLLEIASLYVELRRVGKEFHGPCPVCGGRDRFHVFSDLLSCHCRKCGNFWDAISLFAAKEGLSQIEAARRLGCSVHPFKGKASLQKPLGPKSCTPKFLETSWQQRARQVVHDCKSALWSPEGKSALQYLNSGRGLTATTLLSFDIGFIKRDFSEKRPAITLPWILIDTSVTAVKFRFFDDASCCKGRRFTQLAQSTSLLFGGQNLQSDDLLVLIEGEVNCMSVWQACHWKGIDCLSFGSQGNWAGISSAAELLRVRRYKGLLVWCDEEAQSIKAGDLLKEFQPKLMKSPRGKDANDVLLEFGPGGLLDLVELRSNRKFADQDQANNQPARTRALDLLDTLYAKLDDTALKASLRRLEYILKQSGSDCATEAIQLAELVARACGAPNVEISSSDLTSKVKEILCLNKSGEASNNCE